MDKDNMLNEIAIKMTDIENTIFMVSVELMQREGIPPIMGRIIMGNVYRQFVDNANYNSSSRATVLQTELRDYREKMKEKNTEESKADESIVKKMQKQNEKTK